MTTLYQVFILYILVLY